MLEFDDPRWDGLKGGYKMPFDPRPLLRQLETEKELGPIWSELWNELHHQGDVGEASFAAVPHIVRIYCRRGAIDWNAYALVAIIELARNTSGNPDVADWLKEEYLSAIGTLAGRGIAELPYARDQETCRAIVSIIALKNELRNHASLLMEFSEKELEQIEISWKE